MSEFGLLNALLWIYSWAELNSDLDSALCRVTTPALHCWLIFAVSHHLDIHSLQLYWFICWDCFGMQAKYGTRWPFNKSLYLWFCNYTFLWEWSCTGLGCFKGKIWEPETKHSLNLSISQSSYSCLVLCCLNQTPSKFSLLSWLEGVLHPELLSRDVHSTSTCNSNWHATCHSSSSDLWLWSLLWSHQT